MMGRRRNYRYSRYDYNRLVKIVRGISVFARYSRFTFLWPTIFCQTCCKHSVLHMPMVLSKLGEFTFFKRSRVSNE